MLIAAALNSANVIVPNFVNAIWCPVLPELCNVTSTQPAGIESGSVYSEILRLDRDVRTSLHAVVVGVSPAEPDLLLLPQPANDSNASAPMMILPASTFLLGFASNQFQVR